MTNDKGKQFLLRVTFADVAKSRNTHNAHSAVKCPAAMALEAIGAKHPNVYPSSYGIGRVTAGDKRILIQSDALRKAISDFDETNEFETGIYLCELV